ncbi:MAG: hypothetical protein FJ295_00285 [Planctomycetes bacterium]|nr:hypothetical protein [Planctomycetota bacterium]
MNPIRTIIREFARPCTTNLWVTLNANPRAAGIVRGALADRRLPTRSLLTLVLGAILAAAGSAGSSNGDDNSNAAVPGALPQPSPVASGLQLRVISVGSGVDEQKADLREAIVSEFAEWRSVTLLAELKNVGEKPIRLMGVRYGDSVSGPYIGRSNSDHFAPALFRYDFLTPAGQGVSTPQRTPRDEQFLELSGAQVESLGPGESMVCLLRPLKMRHDAPHWLPSGEFSIRVRYLGASQAAQTVMHKHWPDKGFTGLWHGELISNSVPIKIGERRPLELIWGPVTAGLQAAAELRDYDTFRHADRSLPRNEFPLQGAVSSYVHVKNFSDRVPVGHCAQGDECSRRLRKE